MHIQATAKATACGALQALDTWQRQVVKVLEEPAAPIGSWLTANGLPAVAMGEIATWEATAPGVWARQWEALAPAREVARGFEGKCVLLVFGKFNAGKSSLCNYLAGRAAADGCTIAWFNIVDGDITPSSSPFAEGATETTTALQGVDLGNGLILLDTPGLHSTSAANAALTRLYTDCADGVLWLTSSSAPGQVQELDELVRELHRGKPLLPVITRSDVYEEDEVDGALVSVLCNKSTDDRALQQADVAQRSSAKLQALGTAPALVRAPLSISVATAVGAGDTLGAREASGITRLQQELEVLVDAARHYSGRKQGEVLLHHLQENVMAALDGQWRADMSALNEAVDVLLEALPSDLQAARDAAWRRMVLTLPRMLDAHLAHGDTEATLQQLGEQATSATEYALRTQLPALDLQINQLDVPLTAPVLGTAVTNAAEYQRLHAALEKHAGASVDALLIEAGEHARHGLHALREHLQQRLDQVERLAAELRDIARALRQQACAG